MVFDSWATNLDEGDDNWAREAFVRDRLAGTTTRLGLPLSPDATEMFANPFSADGRFVILAQSSSAGMERFVYDLQTGEATGTHIAADHDLRNRRGAPPKTEAPAARGGSAAGRSQSVGPTVGARRPRAEVTGAIR